MMYLQIRPAIMMAEQARLAKWPELGPREGLHFGHVDGRDWPSVCTARI